MDTAPLAEDGRAAVGTWEWYMVTDEVWAAAGMPHRGFLCVGCLEGRLGRELSGPDFTDAPVNRPGLMGDSPRMAARKANTNP